MVYIQEKTHQQSVHRVSSLVDGCSLDGYGMTTISPGLLPNISINCTFIALLTFHCKGNLFFPVSETLKFQGIHLISWYISKTRSFKEYRVFWAGLMKNRVSEKIPTNCWVLASLGRYFWNKTACHHGGSGPQTGIFRTWNQKMDDLHHLDAITSDSITPVFFVNHRESGGTLGMVR